MVTLLTPPTKHCSLPCSNILFELLSKKVNKKNIQILRVLTGSFVVAVAPPQDKLKK